MSEYKIQDLSSNHKYRTELPNIIFELGLSPTLIGVYAALKRCAGDNGFCTKSTKTLCEQLKISKNTLKSLIRDLCEKNQVLMKPLIFLKERTSEHGDSDTHSISIIDIWPENFSYFNGKNGGGSNFDLPGSKYDQGGSKFTVGVGQNLTGGGSKFDPKEEPIKKNLKEEYISPAAQSAAEPPKNKSNFLIQEEILYSFKDQKVVNGDFSPSKEPEVDITNTIRPTISNENETKSNNTTENKTKSKQKKKKDIKPSIPKIAFRENVLLSQDEHDKLLKKHGEDGLKWILDRLHFAKIQHGYEYKSDYGAINTWVLDAYEKSFSSKIKGNTSSIEENKKNACQIQSTFSSKTYRIDIFPGHIEFIPNTGQTIPDVVKFSENGFLEQVNSILQKREFRKHKNNEMNAV